MSLQVRQNRRNKRAYTSFFTFHTINTQREGVALDMEISGYFAIISKFFTARLAQLVEHSTDTRAVLGSTPRACTKQNID